MNSVVTQNAPVFTPQALEINAHQEVDRIVAFLQHNVQSTLHRRGAVVGISGGIDSSVVLALCVKAFGPGRVVPLMLPERESSPENLPLAGNLARGMGVEPVTEDITQLLEGAGCYQRRDEAVRRIFPQYGEGWKVKITLPGNLLEQETLNVFTLTVIDPQGNAESARLPVHEFLQIVAASNFKQRSRMSMLYYHAELHNYAVIGTANKNEREMGFFVKHGDGGIDVDPIVHLFKTQVYMLAEVLGIPEEIRKRTPTTDTYSAGSSQEEFFFRLPFSTLDLIWKGMEMGVPAEEVARILTLNTAQVERVFEDIQRKKRTTMYLRTAAIALDAL